MNHFANNMQLGVTPDENEPAYMRESGGIRTPFKVGDSRVWYMADYPFNSLVDANNDPGGFALGMVTPPVKTVAEWQLGRQVFKGIPISSDMKESQFQNVPGVSQLLSATGAQETGANGRQFMRGDYQYALSNFVPPVNLASNYLPATDAQNRKLVTRGISDILGVRVRANTKYEQEMEALRKKKQLTDAKSRATRERNSGYRE
jgi:hypothetical protein